MLFKPASRKRQTALPKLPTKIGILANFNAAPGSLDWERTTPTIVLPPAFSGYNGYNLANGEFSFKAAAQGNQGQLDIPGSSRTNLSGMDFTLEMKLRLVEVGNNDEIFRYSNNFNMVNRGSNMVSIYFGNVIPTMDYITIPNLTDKQLHHVVLSYDTDRFKLLADGKLLAEAIRPNTLDLNAAISMLRNSGWGTRWAVGDLKLTQNEALYKGSTYIIPAGDLMLNVNDSVFLPSALMPAVPANAFISFKPFTNAIKRNSGKYYFEVSKNGTNDLNAFRSYFGVIDSQRIVPDNDSGLNLAWYSALYGAASPNYRGMAGWTANAILGIGVDFTAKEVSWYVNGTLLGKSAITGTAELMPCIGINALTNAAMVEGSFPAVMKLSAGVIKYLPIGFKAWNDSSIADIQTNKTKAANGENTVSVVPQLVSANDKGYTLSYKTMWVNPGYWQSYFPFGNTGTGFIAANNEMGNWLQINNPTEAINFKSLVLSLSTPNDVPTYGRIRKLRVELSDDNFSTIKESFIVECNAAQAHISGGGSGYEWYWFDLPSVRSAKGVRFVQETASPSGTAALMISRIKFVSN